MSTQAPFAVAAAEAGKAVFIEKPMALTREDAESIIEAQEKNKVRFFHCIISETI